MSDEATVRAAAERSAGEHLMRAQAAMRDNRSRLGRYELALLRQVDDCAGSWYVEGYVEGHADASASLRELQQAAGEYRAAAWRVSNAIARLESEEPSEERDAELLSAQDEFEAKEQALAALLPAPATATKGDTP